MSVDKTLNQLEKISKQLQDNDITLDEALKLFKEGIELTGKARSQLDKAKMEIKEVVEEASKTFSLEDFDLS